MLLVISGGIEKKENWFLPVQVLTRVEAFRVGMEGAPAFRFLPRVPVLTLGGRV